MHGHVGQPGQHLALCATDDGTDHRALRQPDFVDSPAHHLGGLAVAVRHQFQRLGRAASQAVHRGHVAAPHAGQQRADGHLGRRDRDVDASGLHQIGVGAPVDQRHHAVRTHALGHQRGHDVVLVVVGQREIQIHVIDVLGFEQHFVGGVALQHQRAVQIGGEEFGTCARVFDQLHLVVLFQRRCEPVTDVAAAGDHDSAHRLVQPAQFGGDRADVFRRGQTEHLVARFDHRVAVRHHGGVVAVDGDDARLDVRQVLAQRLDLAADQRAAADRAHRHQRQPPAGEFDHLQRFRKGDEPLDVVGHLLFRADREIDREIVLVKQLRVLGVVHRAQPGDAGRQVVQGFRDAAGAQIGLVGRGDRDQQVGVVGAGLGQHVRAGGIADHGAQVQPVLHRLQAGDVGIDHSDVVRFRHQVFRHRGADLAGPENDDLHAAIHWERWRECSRKPRPAA